MVREPLAWSIFLKNFVWMVFGWCRFVVFYATHSFQNGTISIFEKVLWMNNWPSLLLQIFPMCKIRCGWMHLSWRVFALRNALCWFCGCRFLGVHQKAGQVWSGTNFSVALVTGPIGVWFGLTPQNMEFELENRSFMQELPCSLLFFRFWGKKSLQLNFPGCRQISVLSWSDLIQLGCILSHISTSLLPTSERPVE